MTAKHHGRGANEEATGWARTSVVLLYHRIGWPKPSSLVSGQYVAPKLFRSQLDYLTSRQWQCVSLRDIVVPDPTRKRFALTFDDGYYSVFEHAYPVMKKLGVTGTVFPVANQIGGINEWDRRRGDQIEHTMTADHLRQMLDDGFEIGCHTLTHPHLSELEDDEMQHEIEESKAKLEQLFATSITSFSYPNGDYDERAVRVCRDAGFERAVTTRLGVVCSGSPYEIPRVNIRWNAVGPRLIRKIQRARKSSLSACQGP